MPRPPPSPPGPAQSNNVVGPDQRADELVKAVVSNNIAEWANIVGLAFTDARFDRFREYVTGTLHTCVRIHIGAPNRTYKDVKKDFRALAKTAIEAAEKLDAVQAILDRLPPMYHNPTFRLAHSPFSVTFELKCLAEEARRCAGKWVARRGLQRTEAFKALAQGLEQAFQQATGQPARVNWNAHRDRYEGVFLDLVEIILPTVREIAEAATGRPLPVPKTVMARGKLLQRLAAVTPKDRTRRK
jgi:hypothetical protein